MRLWLHRQFMLVESIYFCVWSFHGNCRQPYPLIVLNVFSWFISLSKPSETFSLSIVEEHKYHKDVKLVFINVAKHMQVWLSIQISRFYCSYHSGKLCRTVCRTIRAELLLPLLTAVKPSVTDV